VKRAPIVIAGTVAGLFAVLEFHTSPAKLAMPGGAALPATAGGTGITGGTGTASGTGNASQPAASPSQSSPSSAGAGSAVRTATGPRVNYSFGVLSVRITVSGGKVTRVGLAYLNDDSDPRSQSIDQQSIPILEQEALQAQSASIQGVSGASYTSAGFTQSLQSALHSLGM
jgi:uncharacterized protein with FMN-binding domain